MPESALLGAFLAGLLGGLHCFAMCGGWIAAVARPFGHQGQTELLPARAVRFGQAAAHAGRLSTYMFLGGAFGAAGGAAFAVAVAPVQRGLYVLANVMLLLLAVSLVARGRPFEALERAGLAVFRRFLPVVTRLAPRRGAVSRYLLGTVWGFTPCALVYGVLPVAMLSGSAGHGALVMLAFGAGTLPNLLAAGWTLTRSRRWFADRRYRLAAAVLIGGFALLGLYRAAFMPDALGQGPFCIMR
ncbi:MAG TPA: sulfite exporter TauE/SafE family protein [Casimicrobiaceae bacterium]|nr:sulfite exporter TauE/SafE family protein [Casimicrobiaceae bacterium]